MDATNEKLEQTRRLGGTETGEEKIDDDDLDSLARIY